MLISCPLGWNGATCQASSLIVANGKTLHPLNKVKAKERKYFDDSEKKMQ